MTALVGRLHQDGLVKRFSDAHDGLAKLIDTTPSGRDALPVEDQVTLSLAVRVASPLIERLAQVPAQRPLPRNHVPLMRRSGSPYNRPIVGAGPSVSLLGPQ